MLKRIIRVVLSRTFIFAVLVVFQIVFFAVLINEFAKAGAVVYWAATFVSAIVLLAILEQNNLNPAYKVMWVLIIALLPAAGALFYLFWGSQKMPSRKYEKLRQIDERANKAIKQNLEVLNALRDKDFRLYQNASYLLNHGNAPLFPLTNEEEYYPLGKDFFPKFLDAIKNAKRYIFLEYYIFQEGWMLETTLEALYKKAQEGVDVRILWDGFGSLFTLPHRFKEKMAAKGIKCHAFSPIELTPHISEYAMLNHRDHRKITAIDGEIAFSGGLNISDEYINIKERFGLWKDNAFMVKGDAAYSLSVTFLRSWDYASGVISDFDLYRPKQNYVYPPLSSETGFVQPYWDSPVDGENVSENAYFNVINNAKKYVYISTPYLILDNEMVTCLSLAAKCGVDVRIITPGIPDKPTVFLVTRGNYAPLLQAGVRIFEYTPGFIHAKMYVSDDKIAIVGSANMDFRSLYLHFENCACFYGGSIVDETKKDMLACFEVSKEIKAPGIILPLHKRVVQIIAKFFSPLL